MTRRGHMIISSIISNCITLLIRQGGLGIGANQLERKDQVLWKELFIRKE